MRNESADGINIRLAESPGDYQSFTSLAHEYILSLGFEVDFHDIALEMAEAQRRYGEAGGGAALLVVDKTGAAIGIAAIRDLSEKVCELKRMYVKPAYRAGGIGKRLCEESIRVARRLGYQSMRLDTLGRLTAANRLYQSQGFRRIAPYTANPMPDALFYEIDVGPDD